MAYENNRFALTKNFSFLSFHLLLVYFKMLFLAVTLFLGFVSFVPLIFWP